MPQLIILSSHGQSGLSEWNVSSVVQKIVLRARTSIMIVRAYQRIPPETAGLRYRRILVPLDGSQRAECVLPVAVTLARSHEAKCSRMLSSDRNAPADTSQPRGCRAGRPARGAQSGRSDPVSGPTPVAAARRLSRACSSATTSPPRCMMGRPREDRPGPLERPWLFRSDRGPYGVWSSVSLRMEPPRC